MPEAHAQKVKLFPQGYNCVQTLRMNKASWGLMYGPLIGLKHHFTQHKAHLKDSYSCVLVFIFTLN